MKTLFRILAYIVLEILVTINEWLYATLGIAIDDGFEYLDKRDSWQAEVTKKVHKR